MIIPVPLFLFLFLQAVFAALSKTYGFLTPDLWPETHFVKDPYQEHTDYLAAGLKTLK